jgi:hypothetical protein
MILKFKTVQEWEEYGLLAEIPEDRKQMVVDCFNFACKWLIEGSFVSDEPQGELETMILPLFYRIAKVVDLTEAQMLDICREFRQTWKKTDRTKFPEYADVELEVVRGFAESKIEQYKQK